MAENLSADDSWRATFAENRLAQLESVLAATPAQRLAWLEEAIRFAHRVGALPRPSLAARTDPSPKA